MLVRVTGQSSEEALALGLELMESGLDPLVGQVGRILDAVDAQDLNVVRVETAQARFG